jgi:beta-xylosidase
LIDHGTGNSGELCVRKTVELKENGNISGDLNGFWEKKEGPDCDYVTLKCGSDTYKGVFFEQRDESENATAVMTFTAIGDNNIALWGSKTDGNDPETDKKPVKSRVMVHDPSIIKGKDGNYYVYGSHLASARSADLMKWEQITPDAGMFNWKQDSIYGDILNNLAESFAWAGYNDGDVLGDHVGVWAPHIIWNPYYRNADKTTGAYMDYYCTSSTWRRSCIGYAVSGELTGGYRYVDTVIFGIYEKRCGRRQGKPQHEMG